MTRERIRLGKDDLRMDPAHRPWQHLLWRIEQRDHPTPAELAEIVSRALEKHGAPEEARDYLARRIRNEVPLGDGGRPGLDEVGRLAQAVNLETWVQLLQAAFRIQGVSRPAPRERALAIVADRCGWTQSTVETYLKRDRKLRRKRSIAEVELDVRAWLATGEVRLDPTEGIITVADPPEGKTPLPRTGPRPGV